MKLVRVHARAQSCAKGGQGSDANYYPQYDGHRIAARQPDANQSARTAFCSRKIDSRGAWANACHEMRVRSGCSDTGEPPNDSRTTLLRTNGALSPPGHFLVSLVVARVVWRRQDLPTALTQRASHTPHKLRGLQLPSHNGPLSLRYLGAPPFSEPSRSEKKTVLAPLQSPCSLRLDSLGASSLLLEGKATSSLWSPAETKLPRDGTLPIACRGLRHSGPTRGRYSAMVSVVAAPDEHPD